MKNLTRALATLCLLLPVVLSAQTHAQEVSLAAAKFHSDFTAMLTFGDSYSDTGNLDSPLFVTDPPYLYGNATNGLVWAEQLADLLNINRPQPSGKFIENTPVPALGGTGYAAGGNNITHLVEQAQVMAAQIEAGTYSVTGTELATIWTGHNDMLGTPPDLSETAQLAALIENHILWLYDQGVRHVLLLTALDVSVTPYHGLRTDHGLPDNIANIKRMTRALNKRIHRIGYRIAQQLPAMTVYLYDAEAYRKAVFANPQDFGFSYTRYAAKWDWNVALDDEDSVFPENEYPVTYLNGGNYFSIDRVHPSAQAHEQIANDVYQFIIQ